MGIHSDARQQPDSYCREICDQNLGSEKSILIVSCLTLNDDAAEVGGRMTALPVNEIN
jgi:hypothetical protein